MSEPIKLPPAWNHPNETPESYAAKCVQHATATLSAEVERLRTALKLAEAALSDIGDADREPGDDVAWCERRAAEPLPIVRSALKEPK
jgi:hypothetical protein